MKRIHRFHGPIPGVLFSLLLLSALTGSVALAEEAPAAAAEEKALPAAETIIERGIEATGGRKAYEALHNRHTSGTLEIPMAGIKGKLDTYEAAPASMSVVTEIEGVGKIVQGSNGVEAWEVSMMGPQIKSGEEKEIALFRNQFNAELRWKERFSSVKTLGTDTVEGRSCYVVEMTPKVGRPMKRCYDTESYDLLRLELIEVNAMGEIPATSLTSDFREVDGIRIPFRMVQKAMGQEFTVTIESVEHNVDFPEGVFDPPPAVQELLAKPAAPAASEGAAEGP